MAKPQLLPSGRYRAQKMQQGRLVLDKVYETEEEAQNAINAFEAQNGTVRDAINRYLLSSTHTGKKEQSRRTEKSRLSGLAASLVSRKSGQKEVVFGSIPLKELSAVDIDRLFEQRPKRADGKPRAPGTRRTEFGILSAMLTWSKRQGDLPTNPARDATRPDKSKARNVRVARSTFHDLMDAAQNPELSESTRRAAWFFVLMDHFGCRPGELASLKLEDIKLDDDVVIFRDTKDDGVDRPRPLDSHAKSCLRQALKYKGAVYLFETTARSTRQPAPGGYSDYAKLVKKAGVVPPRWHPHAHRREFVSSALENGTTVDDVMMATGQRSHATVREYTQTSNLHPRVRQRLEELAVKRNQDAFLALMKRMRDQPEAMKEFKRMFGFNVPADGTDPDDDLQRLLNSIRDE